MRLHSAWPQECRAKSGHAEIVVARVRPLVQKALQTSRLWPAPCYVIQPFHIQQHAGLAYAELAARPHHGSVYAAETFERRMPKKVSRCGVGYDNSRTALPIKNSALIAPAAGACWPTF